MTDADRAITALLDGRTVVILAERRSARTELERLDHLAAAAGLAWARKGAHRVDFTNGAALITVPNHSTALHGRRFSPGYDDGDELIIGYNANPDAMDYAWLIGGARA